YLNKRGKEPSAPRKIGIGMLLTAATFSILVLASIGLPSPGQLGGRVAPPQYLVSVYWLISTYFLLTIAELFLSPMGISFVSRVAPPKYKGLMQGGWFAATAIGNYLVGVAGYLWMKIPLWALWSILVVACLLSAAFMFSIMKKLERVASR
ncbi:MAG: MFS transporter, partial [Candidatus Saccharicenans sp.]